MAKSVTVSKVSPVAAAVAAVSKGEPVTMTASEAVLARHDAENPDQGPVVQRADKAGPTVKRNKAQPARVTVDQRVNLTITSEAVGTVLAERFFDCVKAQGDELKGYLRQIFALSGEGHTAFRARLQKHRDEATVAYKGQEYKAGTANKDEKPSIRPMYKAGSVMAKLAPQIAASAFVRMSEASRFSQACEKGFKPNWDNGYHVLVKLARHHYKKAIGKTTEDAPEVTPVEKALAYIKRVGLTKRQIHSLVAKLDAAD
jgi:hypothetical protein